MRSKFVLLLIIFLVIPVLTEGSPRRKKSSYPGKLKPGTAEHYLHEALFYLNSGSIDVAEKKFLKALKKKPTMLGAINGLGIVYLNKRQFQKAIGYFSQVVRTNPRSYDAYNYLGVIYTELGEYNLAKENLLKAANGEKYRTPENAFVNLAMLEIRKDRHDAALRYVEKGMAKNERFPPLSNLMGVIYEAREDYPRALKWYQHALSLLTEEDVTYLVNIGRIHLRLGNKNKALDILEKGLAKSFAPALKEEIRKLIAEAEKDDTVVKIKK